MTRSLALILAATALIAGPLHAATVIPFPVTTGAKTGGISPQPGPSPAPSSTDIAFAGVTNPSGTFGGAPAAGVLLIANCYTAQGAAIPTLSAGWTSFATVTPGTGGLHPDNGGANFAYMYAPGGVATFSPCTTSGANVGVTIDAVTGANATWATAFLGWANIIVGPGDTSVISGSTPDYNVIVLGSGAHTSNGTPESGSISGLTSATFNAISGPMAVSGQTGRLFPGTGFTITMTGAGSVQPTSVVSYVMIGP